MFRKSKRLAVWQVAVIAICAVSVRAQQETKTADKPLSGPKYLNLRYDENFNYLDGQPESYRSDLFDPIKNIHLADDWRLTLGGEFRFRMEAETNKAYGASDPIQDTFTLYRYMFHADLKYRESFRVFAQGIAAFDEDRELAPRGIDENRFDLHQLFFDLRLLGPDLPLTLRVGRQELQYGAQRWISPLDWANVRRRFDGVKLFAHGDLWDVDLWWMKPVNVSEIQRKQRDRFNEDIDFYGLYVTYKGIKNHGVDFYFFHVDDVWKNRPNANGKTGDRSIHTLGTRFWGKQSGWDYEAEVAGQWGHWARDTVCAWSVSLDGGYTLKEVAWMPRVGVGFDYATGDRSPGDNAVNTFDQLFAFSHSYLGYIDAVARQNIIAGNINLTAWPITKTVKAQAAFHSFWLASKDDALYNAPGAPVRRDITGKSGRHVGNELDLSVVWKLDHHAAMLFGYSHLWAGDVISHTGMSEDVDLFYVQYAMKF